MGIISGHKIPNNKTGFNILSLFDENPGAHVIVLEKKLDKYQTLPSIEIWEHKIKVFQTNGLVHDIEIPKEKDSITDLADTLSNLITQLKDVGILA